jgi:hypothetical protein
MAVISGAETLFHRRTKQSMERVVREGKRTDSLAIEAIREKHMFNSSKLMTLSLLVGVAVMGLPAMAGANTIFMLSQDGGAYTTIATGASLSSLSGSGTFGDFTYTIVGVTTHNTVAISDLLSSATSITNNSTATHTLSIRVSSQDYTLPADLSAKVESGMGASLSSGTLTATFQSYADKNNALGGVSDFSVGLQNCVFNGSTCDTGSGTGIFAKNATPFSLTSTANLTLTGGGIANFSAHENVTSVPEPSSLVLLGSSLILFAGLSFKRKRI